MGTKGQQQLSTNVRINAELAGNVPTTLANIPQRF